MSCPVTHAAPVEAAPKAVTPEGLGVTVLSVSKGGAVLAGSPSTLSALCKRLGFKNACRHGRVFLTSAKMRTLGLGDAVGTDPDWRSR